MEPNKVKKLIYRQFPTLSFFTRPYGTKVWLMDNAYDVMPIEYVRECNAEAKEVVMSLPYSPEIWDCDDSARGMAYFANQAHLKRGGKAPLAYAEVAGMRGKDAHAFNVAVTDSGIFLFDYGAEKSLKNYIAYFVRL